MMTEQQVRSLVKEQLRSEHLLNLVDILKNEHDVLSGVHRNIRWDYLTEVPKEFNPAEHFHDDRYYKQEEVDNLLSAQNEFKELIDTPANYSGYGNYAVRVKATEDGLEFAEFTTPGAHASSHQADGGDPLNNLLLGASPFIKWQSGALTFQTDEGTDTNTIANIKGKGTGIGVLAIYDQDDAEQVEIYNVSGVGYIHTGGTSPSRLNLQAAVAQDVRFWPNITSGNPYFYIYGYKTGVGGKWGRHWVNTGGIYNIQGQDGLKLNWPSFYADNDFLVANNKVANSEDSDEWAGNAFPVKLDDWAEPDNNTDLNVSLARHGLFPKLSGHGAECYAGDGDWLRLYDSTSIIIKILSTASTTTRNSNDTERHFDNPAYTKIKEIKMDEQTGIMKVYWEFKANAGNGTAYTKIYINGVAKSTERSTAETTYQQEDYTLPADLALNDLVQIYAYNTGDPEEVYVRNMRMQYDRSINMLGECTLTTPLVISTQNPFLMTNQDPV